MKLQKQTIEYKKAVIYCRVSSQRQVQEGHGLDSQETRGRAYAKDHDLEVVKVFYEEGISGGLFDRPAMKDLIKFLDDKPLDKFVVIIDDLSRLARDVKVHIDLRAALIAREAKLQCLNFNIDDSEEGETSELLMAVVAQHQRKANRRQVIQKMHARLQRGYWPFCPPLGLRYTANVAHGKILTPYQPVAAILKEAIEKYSDFQLVTYEDVQQFILNRFRAINLPSKLALHGVKNILTNVLYAGYIEYKDWGVELKKAQHEGFVSWETFKKVQARLDMVARPRMRKDYAEDFPLRNFVLCEYCEKPMTAAWFKGKRKRFPYYLCKNKSCANRRKSISRATVEEAFSKLIKDLKAKPKAAALVQECLIDAWQRRKEIEVANKGLLAKQVSILEEKISGLMERAGSAQSPAVVLRYEKEIEKLAEQQAGLQTEIKKESYSDSNFQTTSKEVVKHLEEPAKEWENGVFYQKRRVLGMYFYKGVVYSKNTGFQTPNLPLIVKLLTQKQIPKKALVEMPGVKPGSKAF